MAMTEAEWLAFACARRQRPGGAMPEREVEKSLPPEQRREVLLALAEAQDGREGGGVSRAPAAPGRGEEVPDQAGTIAAYD
jgi:hypothetical protein